MFKVLTHLASQTARRVNQPKIRYLHTRARLCSAYEGEGRTTVSVLNKELELGLMINGVSQVGFRLNNEMTVLGPMIILPRTVLSWNISDLEDINEDTLSLFSVLHPRLDILVIGVGDALSDMSFQTKMFPIMKKMNINLEVLPTEKACATFNFLNSEGRYIAAALIPPTNITTTDDELMKTKLRYQNLYERDD